MRVIIIEDEIPAANHLARLLKNIDLDVEVIMKLDSVDTAVKFLQSASDIDLIFMDIQLADGLSFSIFEQVDLTTPVIFTTAFDQYTLKAFKVNSLDYLLKPIDEGELNQAVEKYNQLYPKTDKGLSDRIYNIVREMTSSRESPGVRYKERLLIKRGRHLHYLKTETVAWFFADGKLCYAVDFTGSRHLLECNLNHLEEELAPNKFYRVSRHLLVNIESVKKVHPWMGGRLKLELLPPMNDDTLVSRERVNGFKDWLGQ